MGNWRGYVEWTDFDNRLRVLVQKQDEDTGNYTVIEPLVLTTEDGARALAVPHRPTIEGRVSDVRGILQAFTDLAWQIGIRPTELGNHERANASQARHLDDMRMLVGKAHGVDLGK